MTTTSQLLKEFFPNATRPEPRALGPHEARWVERQQALEQTGYMLRPRYRPNWRPSWAGTNKFYRQFKDGRNLRVSAHISRLGARAYDISATHLHQCN